MKQSIKTRIFLPVFMTLVLFPVIAIAIFWQSSLWYMKRSAEKGVDRIIHYIDYEVSRIPEFHAESGDGDSAAKESAKELLTKIRKEFGKKNGHAQLMIFNSKLTEVYPDKPDVNIFSDYISRYWQEALKNGALSPGEVFYAELSEETYVARLYEADTDYNIKTKYFIVYEQVLDVSQMVSRTGGLVAMMALILFAMSAVMVWMISRSIVRPIEILCSQTERIGTDSCSLQEKTFSVRELEQLREAFCAMDRRLTETQEEKQRIFQNISHDLRTPLASIIGYADGIRRGIAREPVKSAEIILRESRRMNRMVDNILTISKLDCHAWQISLANFSLDAFIDEQTDVLQGLAGEKQLLYQEDASTRSLIVRSDPELLTRIFQNVVSNCLRYAESQVTVSLSHDGEFAVITVEDDGPGIPPKDLKHVFERYYKGEKGEFGIGLSLVWSGMQYLGGRAEVSRREPPEHGTVYRLFLPAQTV